MEAAREAASAKMAWGLVLLMAGGAPLVGCGQAEPPGPDHAGGQTGQPSAGAGGPHEECEDRCCGDGSPEPQFVPAEDHALLAALDPFLGAREVPLSWLPTDVAVPLAPAHAMPTGTSSLTLDLRFVGGEQLTVKPCDLDPVLPVTLALRSADGALATEVLAFARQRDAGFELTGPAFHGDQLELVTALPDNPAVSDAVTKKESVLIPVLVTSEAPKTLPTLDDLVPGLATPSMGACQGPGARLAFDPELGAVGHLCLPGMGRAVWPLACGGVAVVPMDATEHLGIPGLLQRGALHATGDLQGLLTLELQGDEDICLGRALPEPVERPAADPAAGQTTTGQATSATPMPASMHTGPLGVTSAQVILSLAGQEVRGPASVEISAADPELGISMSYRADCIAIENGDALTALASAIATERSTDLAAILDAGIVSGAACADGFFRQEVEGLASGLELMLTLRAADGSEVRHGVGTGLE